MNPQLKREDFDAAAELQLRERGTLLSNQTEALNEQLERERLLAEQELTDDQKKEIKEKLDYLKLCSRWLPDSSMTTYFGKPAFHAYGNGNTNPTSKGTCYGDHMKTHNVNPHSGGNRPKNSQVYGRAMLGGTV